jgi:hypothetical protein
MGREGARHEDGSMKKSYSPPVLIRYGSIAECTFATPGNGGLSPTDPNFVPTADLGGGNYACGPTAGVAAMGGKSALVLQCDWFGEYSHS